MQIAARLAAAAEADAVWVSADCHRRLGPFVRTAARPPITLQADGAPLTPHRVLGESGLESRLDASEPGGLTPYAGRANELHAAETRMQAIQGHIGSQDRRNQGKRDAR